MSKSKFKIDPERDLFFERVVPLRRSEVYAAWTQPELIVQWFTPAPWKTKSSYIDLRPGGEATTVMVSPEGQEFPNTGCILECVENERFVFTSALGPGFRPLEGGFFTGVIELEDHPDGTLYRAIGIHGNVENCKKHEQMGFIEGWGKALDQLVALMTAQRAKP